MRLKVVKSTILNSLQDLEDKFSAKSWLDKNIHRYEDSKDEQTLITDVFADFFTDYKGTVSIVSTNKKNQWLVMEHEIPFAVVLNATIIPCNTIQAAEEIYTEMAHKRLKRFRNYREYDKTQMDFTVLKSMVEKYDIKIRIVGDDTIY